MSDNVFDKFVVDIVFNTKKFDDSTKKVNDNIESFASTATKSFGLVATGLAGLFSAETIKNLVTGFANTGSQIQYMSDALQDGTKNLQIFQKAAEQNGGTKEGITSILGNISARSVAARHGQDSQFLQILSSLGINNLSQTPTDLLKNIGQGLSRYDIDQQRYIENILGIDPNQIRFLIGSKSEVQNNLDQASKTNLNQQQLNAATEAQTALKQLSQEFDYTKDILGSQFVPALTDISKIVNGLFTGDLLNKVPGLSFINKWTNKAFNSFPETGNAIHNVISNISSTFDKNTPAGYLATKISGGKVFDKYFTNLDTNPEYFNNLVSKDNLLKGSKLYRDPKLYPKDIPYWDSPAYKAAQLERENPNKDPNISTYDDVKQKDGSIKRIGHHGLYQISTEAANSIKGNHYTKNDLLDPIINSKVRDQLMDSYAKEIIGNGYTDIHKIAGGASARFNGGLPDQNLFLRTGKSVNSSKLHPMDYSNEVDYNAQHKFANLNAGLSYPQSTTINVSGGITMNGVQDVQGMANNVQQASRTRAALSFSSSKGL